MAYVCHVAATFIFGTYMVITCESDVEVGCDLAHIYTCVRSIFSERLGLV